MSIFSRIRSAFIGTGVVPPPKSSPDELLGELFQDVQLRRVFPDGMTFVDMVPANRLRKVLLAYEQQRQRPDFDLHKFVSQYFKDYLEHTSGVYKTNPKHTVEQHINELWNVLTRQAYTNKGSLTALPYPYVVPGGRFGAQWYWDSYFTMLGLAASNRYDLIEGMLKNYAFMIRKYGYIIQANRTYYVGRSQPPFFSHMLKLLARKEGKAVYVRYLPYLISEYRFWTRKASELSEDKPAYRRTVRLSDGTILSRYYDNKRTPRPESYKEDVDTALKASDRVPSKVYVDLRAAAESGWDFSSRWFKDGKNLKTIHTTDILQVDLNCLLVHEAQTIAEICTMLKQGKLAKIWQKRAQRRIEAIQKYFWSEEKQFFFDYDFIAGEHTACYSLAAAFPLYVGIATQAQADAVAKMIKEKFLKPGGLVATLAATGEQWDSPNGWAPLHWVVIKGLRNYGHAELADEIKKRWITTNVEVFKKEGKLVEKYNVVAPNEYGGGGEYELQDGFGWTNGVLMALLSEDKESEG
ncbi:MAG TPA: alpha,alpha-trehalase TreF [Candidatus Saccharimonadales bacterium]|nr:alpha,alpha-trehalase TreF [Candidatus Saccharimonadales bacterium]